MKTFTIISTFALITLLHWIASDSTFACPTCKDGLHGTVALGYAISILVMMGMPFTIFSFWVVTIWRLRAKFQTNLKSVDATLAYEHNQRTITSSASANFEV